MNSVLRGLVTVVAPLLAMTAAPPAASRAALAVANPTLKENLVGELREEGVTVLGAAGNLTFDGARSRFTASLCCARTGARIGRGHRDRRDRGG